MSGTPNYVISGQANGKVSHSSNKELRVSWAKHLSKIVKALFLDHP